MTRSKLLAMLRKFENAARDDEMRGAMHPEDRDDIHTTYLRVKDRLVANLLNELNNVKVQ